MEQALVSIIIPTYNLEGYIAGCLKSVQNQDYVNLEILVLDDGSQDGTRAIVEEFQQADSRIRLISLSHQGVSAVRNRGIGQATGTYLTFLDGDDAIRPDFIRNMVEAMSDVDLAVCGYDQPDSVTLRDELAQQPSIPGAERLYSAREYLSGMLREELSEAVWGKLYRRSALAEVRFPEDLCNNEDKYFLYRLLPNLNRVRVLERNMSLWLRRPGSLSRGAYVSDNYVASRRMLEQPALEDAAHIGELRRHYRLMLLLNCRMLIRSELSRDEKRQELARLRRELKQAPRCSVGLRLGIETAVLSLGNAPYSALVRLADLLLKD